MFLMRYSVALIMSE